MIRKLTILAATTMLVATFPSVGSADHRTAAHPRLGGPPLGPGPVIPVAPAVLATNRLALELLPRLGGSGNVVFSPYSIEAALAMVDQGAAGATASQIAHVLGGNGGSLLGRSNDALSGSLSTSVTAPQGTAAAATARLLIANGLWVQRGLALESPFPAALSNDFGAAPQAVDFASQPEVARQTINSWVADHTGRLIRNLMGPGAISSRTALVLANAIYLKARWASPFVKDSTTDQPFLVTAKQRVSAPFMTQPPTSFGYVHGQGYQAIELPYLNSDLSMLAVMPKAGTLGEFEGDLKRTGLNRITGALAPHRVDLRMPKLELALHTDLTQELSTLGMPLAFSNEADFSQITKATSLKIAAVEHGAKIKIDEAGTVAAAATGISLEPTAIENGPAVKLTLDHPYLLFLRDDSTGTVLFAARVTDPTQS
jgi:serpin B